ncbi:aldehyde dehydrogenase 3, member A2 [Thoreauomyces humboldtii]|nr:aldehyde dehydrogenase 3, member A2 [Thoreauomyces humboldtii]
MTVETSGSFGTDGTNVTSTNSSNLAVPPFTDTPISDIATIVEDARASYNTDISKPIAFRKAQLRALYRMLDENEAMLAEASFKDMKRAPAETWTVDLLVTKNDIVDAIDNLDDWAKPERVSTNLANALNSAQISREPLGLVLIIAAIAGGNAAIIKPSEVASHAAAAMTYLLPKYLDPRVYKAVNGGVPETTALLSIRFDHIFYTGNGAVGRIVAKAAAPNLTPTVLELGGKSPVIIDHTVDLDIVAKRIMWAKGVNCGQTCIAPDYVLIPKDMMDPFAAACGKAVRSLYGDDPRTSPNYARMATRRHYDRLASLLEKQRAEPGCEVAVGGICDPEDLFISPTVITGVQPHGTYMKDEIFGPILPVVAVGSVDEAIAFVRAREKPLALYVFSKSRKTVDHVLARTDSGNTVVNDLLMNMTVCALPFGGVGASGSGKYHGHHGFLEYTHARSMLYCPSGFEAVNDLRYPPKSYTPTGRRILQLALESRLAGPVTNLFRRFLKFAGIHFPWFIVVAIAAALGWFAGNRTA